MTSRGFTLVETLIALVVAASAAAVVFALLRGLMDRAAREQAHALSAMRLLNDATLAAKLPRDTAQQHVDGDRLWLDFGNPSAPRMEVRNARVHTGKSVLPPVRAAFTPFQTFHVGDDRFQFTFIAPALLSPEAGRIAVPKDDRSGRPP